MAKLTKALLIVLTFLTAAASQDKSKDATMEVAKTPKTGDVILKISPVEFLIFPTQDGKQISISLKNGKVTLPDGYDADKASVEFWRAVEKAFPVYFWKGCDSK